MPIDKVKCSMIQYTSVNSHMLFPLKWAAVAQSVVRRIGSAEVTGPIPVSSSIFNNIRMSRGA